MLFSIVIPVYNMEKYLDECIESILCQVEKIDNDCEIVLVDDGSTDNSANICDVYQKKYPEMIKVFHKKNEGLLATRRYGFKRASGEYILNCDSDDLLENEMLYELKKIIIKYNSPDVLIFNYNYLIESCKMPAFNNIFTTKQDIEIDKKSVLEMFLKNYSIVSLCTKIFKRKCIDINKDYSSFYRVSNGEDSLQSIEIYNNAQSFVYINKELYNYRMGSGMTCKFDENYYKGFKIIIEQIKKQKKKWNLKEFNKLFSIKVLQTVGRAITQSRYNHWPSYRLHRKYFKEIREDEFVEQALEYIFSLKKYLQRSHFYLLILFKNKFYLVLEIFLNIKNIVSR